MLAAAKVLADQQCLVAAGCLDERTSNIIGGCWLLEILLAAGNIAGCNVGPTLGGRGCSVMLAAAVGKLASSIDGGCWLHSRADQQHRWWLLVAR